MTVQPQTDKQLLQDRNRIVARSFYRHLKAEGFSHEQIIELSSTLLDLVTTDMQTRVAQAK